MDSIGSNEFSGCEVEGYPWLGHPPKGHLLNWLARGRVHDGGDDAHCGAGTGMNGATSTARPRVFHASAIAGPCLAPRHFGHPRRWRSCLQIVVRSPRLSERLKMHHAQEDWSWRRSNFPWKAVVQLVQRVDLHPSRCASRIGQRTSDLTRRSLLVCSLGRDRDSGEAAMGRNRRATQLHPVPPSGRVRDVVRGLSSGPLMVQSSFCCRKCIAMRFGARSDDARAISPT